MLAFRRHAKWGQEVRSTLVLWSNGLVMDDQAWMRFYRHKDKYTVQ